jgi:capsid protein
MVVGQAITRVCANILQEGFTPDPNTGSQDLDNRLKELWKDWSEDPDYCHSEGEFSFQQLENLALRSAIRDGDIWFLPLKNGTLQPVEAHRVRTPTNTVKNVILGVEVDEAKRRKSVWMTKQELNLTQILRRVSETVQYPIRDSEGIRQVLQIYFPQRTSQTRGVSALAPVSDCVGMHDDLQFATLVKAQLASLLVILRSREAGENGTWPNSSGFTGTDDQQAQVNSIPLIGAGIDYAAAPG